MGIVNNPFIGGEIGLNNAETSAVFHMYNECLFTDQKNSELHTHAQFIEFEHK